MNCLNNQNFPHNLKRLKNIPKELFYSGNLELLSLPKVAVVGSRKASVYTKECVNELCKTLVNFGVCIVSGGAIGVDIVAHKASLPCTIGVFATGLDIIYPPSNTKTIEQIYAQGLALSGYPAKTPALGFRFLERNRIVVALSQALVIAQADLQSGSMQSARLASELEVPIYVLPQRINESRGTNKLLNEGKAKIIDNFENFASIFGKKSEIKTQSDEILEFCNGGVSLDMALSKFGDKVYEYELLGKLEIKNLQVKSMA
ncbi:DNA-processing protein DprA [Campylobacter sp. 9BO]|uniref:DNA-processing protein DprA n=1 Tax=Campylobacter sp. 9BO TaxID=3424759 RepID=UPI003D345D4E